MYNIVPKKICGVLQRMLSGTRPGSGCGTSCSRGGGGGTSRGRSSPTPGTGTGGSRRMILATQVRGVHQWRHQFREDLKINGVQLIGLFSPPLPRHQSNVHSSVPPFNGHRRQFWTFPKLSNPKIDKERIFPGFPIVRRDPGEADDDAPHHQVEIRRREQTHSLAGGVQWQAQVGHNVEFVRICLLPSIYNYCAGGATCTQTRGTPGGPGRSSYGPCMITFGSEDL